jgi:2,5-diketo-D-gluconate reductase B
MPSVELPSPGLGTMRYETPAACSDSVRTALEMGYRHLDTAQKYHTERSVAQGIRESPVPSEDVFLATKVAEENLAPEDVVETAHNSLERLGVDVVDMLYVHWPAVTYEAEATLSAFNELLAEGTTREVGLGNFTPELIDEARAVLDRDPLAVQVEMHPFLHQEELRAYVREHDMYLVAYCPMMRGEIFDQPELVEIAEDAGVSVAALAMAWLSSKERVVPIPKASGEAHLRENFEGAATELDPETLARIDAIDREHRVVDPPSKGPWNW